MPEDVEMPIESEQPVFMEEEPIQNLDVDPQFIELLSSINEGVSWILVILTVLMAILLINVFLTGLKAGK